MCPSVDHDSNAHGDAPIAMVTNQYRRFHDVSSDPASRHVPPHPCSQAPSPPATATIVAMPLAAHAAPAGIALRRSRRSRSIRWRHRPPRRWPHCSERSTGHDASTMKSYDLARDRIATEIADRLTDRPRRHAGRLAARRPRASASHPRRAHSTRRAVPSQHQQAGRGLRLLGTDDVRVESRGLPAAAPELGADPRAPRLATR